MYNILLWMYFKNLKSVFDKSVLKYDKFAQLYKFLDNFSSTSFQLQ